MNAYLCVPLRGKRGGVAYITESAWNLVDGYCWYSSTNGYVVSLKAGLMHRRLMAAEEGEHVDHQNFSRTDNRYENLRTTTQQNNNRHCQKRDTRWPYKGVRFSYGKWTARITVNRKGCHLGSFNSPEEAAVAYVRPVGHLVS